MKSDSVARDVEMLVKILMANNYGAMTRKEKERREKWDKDTKEERERLERIEREYMAILENAAHEADALRAHLLSENTQKAKRNVLLVSSIAIFMDITNTFPTQISALGINFSNNNQLDIKFWFFLLLSFLIASFLVNIYIDISFYNLRVDHKRKLEQLIEKEFKDKTDKVILGSWDKDWAPNLRIDKKTKGKSQSIFLSRFFLDVLAPFLISVCAAFLLLL